MLINNLMIFLTDHSMKYYKLFTG